MTQPSTPELPLELWEQVVANAMDFDTLFSLAQVSKAFNHLAEKFLYRNIEAQFAPLGIDYFIGEEVCPDSWTVKRQNHDYCSCYYNQAWSDIKTEPFFVSSASRLLAALERRPHRWKYVQTMLVPLVVRFLRPDQCFDDLDLCDTQKHCVEWNTAVGNILRLRQTVQAQALHKMCPVQVCVLDSNGPPGSSVNECLALSWNAAAEEGLGNIAGISNGPGLKSLLSEVDFIHFNFEVQNAMSLPGFDAHLHGIPTLKHLSSEVDMNFANVDLQEFLTGSRALESASFTSYENAWIGDEEHRDPGSYARIAASLTQHPHLRRLCMLSPEGSVRSLSYAWHHFHRCVLDAIPLTTLHISLHLLVDGINFERRTPALPQSLQYLTLEMSALPLKHVDLSEGVEDHRDLVQDLLEKVLDCLSLKKLVLGVDCMRNKKWCSDRYLRGMLENVGDKARAAGVEFELLRRAGVT